MLGGEAKAEHFSVALNGIPANLNPEVVVVLPDAIVRVLRREVQALVNDRLAVQTVPEKSSKSSAVTGFSKCLYP